MSLDFAFINKHIKNNRVVLLFHGMTGSPYELKKYGQFLHSIGYDVFANCLPGHGDKVNEINTVKYTDWLNFAFEQYEYLSTLYDEVYVSGLCLGAVLAIAVAQKYKNVKGIIALSTTLFLDGWRLPWYSFLLPIGLTTLLRFYYTYPECDPYGIKNIKTRNIIKKLLEKGNVGMNDFPMTCIYELFKLSKYVRNKALLREIVAPILLIHSKEDDLTSAKSSKIIFKNITSNNKKLIILNNSYHMVLYDNQKDFVYECVKEFLEDLSKIEELCLC